MLLDLDFRPSSAHGTLKPASVKPDPHHDHIPLRADNGLNRALLPPQVTTEALVKVQEPVPAPAPVTIPPVAGPPSIKKRHLDLSAPGEGLNLVN